MKIQNMNIGKTILFFGVLLLLSAAVLLANHGKEPWEKRMKRKMEMIKEEAENIPEDLSTSQVELVHLRRAFHLPIRLHPSNSCYDFLLRNATNISWEECFRVTQGECVGICARKLCEAMRAPPLDLWQEKMEKAETYADLFFASGKGFCFFKPEIVSLTCKRLGEMYSKKGVPKISDFSEYSAFAMLFSQCTGNDKYFETLVNYEPKNHEDMLWFARAGAFFFAFKPSRKGV